MIHTEKLTKTFTVKKETVEAVKGVNIDVARGELVAFLGPNGAGKSTTCGCSPPCFGPPPAWPPSPA